jgi:hypothetical protein
MTRHKPNQDAGLKPWRYLQVLDLRDFAAG